MKAATSRHAAGASKTTAHLVIEREESSGMLEADGMCPTGRGGICKMNSVGPNPTGLLN
jgi:hypothetical protein